MLYLKSCYLEFECYY